MIKKRKAESGFTLIEVLIVVAIILVMVAIAGPNFMVSSSRNKMRTAARDLKNNLELARIAAVKKHQPVVFEISKNGKCKAGEFNSGGSYAIFVDTNNDKTFKVEDDEAIEFLGKNSSEAKYVPGVDVALCPNTSAEKFHFTSRGFPAQTTSGSTMFTAPATITIASGYKSGSSRPAYRVSINPSGNISIESVQL